MKTILQLVPTDGDSTIHFRVPGDNSEGYGSGQMLWVHHTEADYIVP